VLPEKCAGAYRRPVLPAGPAAAAAFLLTVHLGHDGAHRQTAGERMTMFAIGGDDGIFRPQCRHHAGGYRFLADIQMQKTADFRGAVKLGAFLRQHVSGRLRSSELADPTITVSSLGERGVETVYPVIYPPQVAIVGFGAIVERPWVVAGQIVARPVLNATLAADHRVSDGHRGGLFLKTVDRLLQQPEKL
jgi:hypothetical protein